MTSLTDSYHVLSHCIYSWVQTTRARTRARGLWLVHMWTGPRAPTQAAHVTQATGSGDSDCCRYIKRMLAILRTIKLALVIKTSSSLAIGFCRIQASRGTKLQCEQPLQVNNSRSASSLDPSQHFVQKHNLKMEKISSSETFVPYNNLHGVIFKNFYVFHTVH